MKRLREFFESIAFAGLKPAGQKTEARKLKWLGPLAGPVERMLNGPTPTDPLYLTNRTMAQKAKSWVVIGIPCLILAAGVGVLLSNVLNPPEAKPLVEPSAKEVGEKILPNIDKNLKLEANNDVEVVEVKIEHTGGSRVVGVVRNTTSHEIAEARMVLDLTDTSGSQVGGVEVRVQSIPASKTKLFSMPILQHTAAFVLVREVNAVK
jgi:hypothetical protein